jgi:hypothetical protein
MFLKWGNNPTFSLFWSFCTYDHSLTDYFNNLTIRKTCNRFYVLLIRYLELASIKEAIQMLTSIWQV